MATSAMPCSDIMDAGAPDARATTARLSNDQSNSLEPSQRLMCRGGVDINLYSIIII